MIALLTGLCYVFLASQKNRICWLFGIVSCGIIAYQDVTLYQLYSDAVLQSFYVIMGFWGFWSWGREEKPKGKPLTLNHHLLGILGSVIGAVVVGYVLRSWSDAAVPFLDAFTTILSILATLLLVNERKETWLYWIVINLLYIYIYGSQGAAYFTVLSAVYLVMSLRGWFWWKNR